MRGIPETLPVLAVSDRRLCRGSLTAQLRRLVSLRDDGTLAAEGIDLAGLILREKDLDPLAWRELAAQVQEICAAAGLPLYPAGHPQTVRQLACPRLHLPLPQLAALRARGFDPGTFTDCSVSCHSLAGVRRAERLGATRIILGTIFATDCKPGLAGRGPDFLRDVCAATKLPVFAIGGIEPARLPLLRRTGAAGGCMMSWMMRR
ncbi:MAG: thiamine phosphate synthase [Anaerovoracaceae bacterium]